MASVNLVPMDEKQFEQFLGKIIPRYAEENVQCGYWLESEALARSKADHDKLLPKGYFTPGHFFWLASDSSTGRRVGSLWLSDQTGGAERSGFIYDVFIEPEERHKGYGKAMMLALDEEAKKMGLKSLALHVFVANDVAVHLYESVGYSVRSMNMKKQL